MTDIEISRLRELCDAATDGPWERINKVDMPQWVFARTVEPDWDVGYDGSEPMVDAATPENAEFIAAARSALPVALDEIERLRSLLENTAPMIRSYIQSCDFMGQKGACADATDFYNKMRDELK